MTDRLGRLLLVTLEVARLDADLPCSTRFAHGSTHGEASALWGAAIAHPGSYDLQLTGYDARGWRATFYPIVSNPTMKAQ